MSVPKGMNVTSLKGKFLVNKTLSDSLDDIFRLQSIHYIVAKVSGLSTIQLDVVVEPVDGEKAISSMTDSPASAPIFRITMKQALLAIGPFGLAPLRAIGLAPTRKETRTLDRGEFTDNEAALGPTKSKWWICTVDDVLADSSLDAFHKEGSWSRCREVIRISTRSQRPEKAKLWSAEHLWSLEEYGEGRDEDLRYTARLMTWRGSGKTREIARVKLVHDFVA